MSKYIDADQLIADIQSIINSDHPIEYNLMEKQAYNSALNDAINLITSLQQEQPEVDLEKELIFYHNEHFSPCENGVLFSERTGRELDYSDYEDIARHFYELGKNSK